MNTRLIGFLAASASALLSVSCLAQPAQPPSPAPAAAPEAAEAAEKLPHITIDLQNKTVDLDATVISRDVPWLELLACSPNSREHEAVLTVPARPSHIHLALVMIGLEPGAPMAWVKEGKEIKATPARGPRVGVYLLVDFGGREVEVPADQWIVHKETKRTLPDNVWLFTGSRFSEIDGKRVYHADIEGDVLTLVNFGADVLAKESELTNQTDDGMWVPRVEAIPPLGTRVKIRLKPVAAPGPGK